MSGDARSSKRLVLIGGGTGSFTLLSGLKRYFADISAIVNMSDDGGSTGVLRDELGVLPPGDIRQCLVALSRDQGTMRELFNYRFDNGGLHGHSFGNLFLSALEKITGSFSEAVDHAARVLNIEGRVLPVTLTNSNLVLLRPDGTRVEGEFAVANHKLEPGERPQLELVPYSVMNPRAADAIVGADIIVIAPGHLYGSIAPALLVDGMRQAIKRSNAKILYVCNLVTKPGQTDGFMVHDYAQEIERFIGEASLDIVLYSNEQPDAEVLQRYTAEGEHWVGYDLDVMKNKHYQAIGANLLSNEDVVQKASDKLIKRNLIRHDGQKIAALISSLV